MRDWTSRFLLLLVLWWVLSEGNLEALGAGALAGALVASATVGLFPGREYRVRWHRVPGFFLFFLVRSVMAGVDVAGRLLRPSLPISPGEISVELRLPVGAPRALLANILSLLPGTLSVELRDQTLKLHCLERDADMDAHLRDVESRVAALFGLALEAR